MMVMVENDKPTVLFKRESYDDLIRLDCKLEDELS